MSGAWFFRLPFPLYGAHDATHRDYATPISSISNTSVEPPGMPG